MTEPVFQTRPRIFVVASVLLKQGKRSFEDRLDDLERLKRRDMVTPEVHTAKRQEILQDL